MPVATAVEHDLGDTLLLRAIAQQRANGLRELRPLPLRVLGIERRRRGERRAGIVVHELGVDVRQRAEHREAWTRRAAAHLLAHPHVSPCSTFVSRRFRLLSPRYAFAPTLPALPAFFLMRSSAYLMPFALYGSGTRRARMRAAISPTICLSLPTTFSFCGVSSANDTPGGGSISIGCEKPSASWSFLPASTAR